MPSPSQIERRSFCETLIHTYNTPGKLLACAIGVILMIGSGVAMGLFYTHTGYFAACGGGIIAGILCLTLPLIAKTYSPSMVIGGSECPLTAEEIKQDIKRQFQERPRGKPLETLIIYGREVDKLGAVMPVVLSRLPHLDELNPWRLILVGPSFNVEHLLVDPLARWDDEVLHVSFHDALNYPCGNGLDRKHYIFHVPG